MHTHTYNIHTYNYAKAFSEVKHELTVALPLSPAIAVIIPPVPPDPGKTLPFIVANKTNNNLDYYK